MSLPPALRPSPWLPATRPRANAALRLFCLPYAGAGASAFRGWAELLPQLDVAPVLLPGREGRIGEPPEVDLDELAAAVAAAADRPYAVFGHSFGARLGFELCRALVRGAAPPPRWLFVSGAPAPHLPRRTSYASALPDAEFIARVAELGGTPPAIFDDPDMRELALRVLRADLGYVDRYVYQAGDPLACPITVYAGDDDTETGTDDLFAWGELTAGPLAVRVLPGDHFFLHSARPQLLASLAADLATGPASTRRVAVPVLERGEVHVWHARTDELAVADAELRRALSDDEVARAEGFRFTRHASRFIRRRWLLRRLLAAYGADIGTGTVPAGANGKPSPLAGGRLRWNASSSEGTAVVAVTREHDVGVDVERLRPVGDRDLLAATVLTPGERAGLAALDPAARDAAFLRLWTVKEAFLKAEGTGLSLDPARVESSPSGPGRWTVSTVDGGIRWSVVAVDVGPGQVVSLAVPPGGQPRVRVLALTPGRLS